MAFAALLPGARMATAEQPLEPLLLFMKPSDVNESVGPLVFHASPLKLRGTIAPLAVDGSVTVQSGSRHGLANDISFRPLLAVPCADGGYDVYGSESRENPKEPKQFLWKICRAHTFDARHFTDLREVFTNPPGPWLIEASMTREETTGKFFFFQWSRSDDPGKGHALWGFVNDIGGSWRPLSTKPLYLDHDAFGVMWDPQSHRFLSCQVTTQSRQKPYSDNLGDSRRRVLSIRTSKDGVTWNRVADAGDSGLITPDVHDPEDLEFYRMQPFAYGDRFVAMVDLYAASPLFPGRHGPHLGCEWWVSDDGMRWERPWRGWDAHGDAPYPIKMSPMRVGREMLFWVSGQVRGLPEYRLAGIGARSNAEFSSKPFKMPARELLLNATIPAGSGLFRQSYIQVEIRDENHKPINGYEREKCLLQNVDDTRIPLSWNGATGKELAGRKISLKFCLRQATLYMLGTVRSQ